MTPSYSNKNGVRYRYYISHALLQSRKAEAGSVNRVPTAEIEEAVVAALRQNEVLSKDETALEPRPLQETVEKITLQENELGIELVDKSLGKRGMLSVQWNKKSPAAPKGVFHTPATSTKRLSPETCDTLLSATARARKWVADIESGAVSTISEIAKREGNVERHIRLLMPLAFASPALIRSLIDGNAPNDPTVTGLAKQMPFTWNATPITR
ncbi:MAG: hypothetical protein IPK23_00120 [Rhizobiales bacterium]|nr:hypothetical protein [Hyphomicrobiales bacterium]